jgi:hypothetical protein
MRRSLALELIACYLLILSVQVQARQVYQLGGHAGFPWSEMGSLVFLDVNKVPGGIHPFSTELSHDLATTLLERGGDVGPSQGAGDLPNNWLTDRFLLLDGDPTTAFVHEPMMNIYSSPGVRQWYSWDMRLDLGAPFPVERIRIHARPDHPENLIREYRLWVNDGSEKTRTEFGDPIWTLLKQETDNLKVVIDLDIEPQIIRHIYLRPWETGQTWEVSELEAFGQGFVPTASFVSEPIDLGATASLGRIWWQGQRDPGAKILIQTRSGHDTDPVLYWRKTGIGDQQVTFDEKGQRLTQDAYESLAPVKRGEITQDLDNWSVWQTYAFEEGLEGTRLLSPSPRRYLQLRIEFSSEGPNGGWIDSLRFEYSQPPVVQEAIGEIHPLTVEAAVPTRFTYMVWSRLASGQGGFNALELRTLAQVEAIEAVRIDGETVAFSVDQEEEHRLLIHFPRIAQDQTLLEVDLLARVFRYGTAFSGAVLDTDVDEVGLEVTPGDAVEAVLSDGLNVRTTLAGSLLEGVEVGPNPFSPNGDGVNDRLAITYALLRLTEAVPLQVELFDLSGRRVRLLDRSTGGSAFYTAEWDGRDEANDLVHPGLYLYRIVVEAESGKEEKIGHVAVVY